MDKGTDDKEEQIDEKIIEKAIEKAIESEKTFFGSSAIEVLEKYRKIMKRNTQITLDSLDKLIKSRWIWGSKKYFLRMFRANAVEASDSRENIINLFEYLIGLRISIMSLYLMMEGEKGETIKEVDELKSKIDALIDNPDVQGVARILQNMQKIAEQREKEARELYRG